MEVIKLTVGALSENCYILKYSEKEAAIIDPGDWGERISAVLEKYGVTPTKILLTHGHFDHIGAAAFLKDKYNIPLFISEKDKDMLSDKEKSGAEIAPFVKFYPVKADGYLKDGDIIALGDVNITVMDTPGHSAGSLCYIGEDFIFTGDTVFKDSVGRSDLYSGSYGELCKSIKKISALTGNYKLYCGHGDDTDLETEKSFNSFFC